MLIENKRGSRNAKLFCVSRDIENAEINLQFDSDLKKWVVTDEPTAPKSKDNIFLAALYVYIKKKIDFSGTTSELIEKLKSVSDETFYPNRVTRDLVRNGYTLRKYGIDFEYKRTRNCRLIILHYDRERDSSDSKNTSEVTVNQNQRTWGDLRACNFSRVDQAETHQNPTSDLRRYFFQYIPLISKSPHFLK
ncbi:hypothetical protein [Ruminococcus bicirculans (ex Wegman et al. 2014)]|uniref:hypothetical protein n=1 Tax=Ruminococcus bicirculans (ex Wegman et al. 2014) TaxID=1160721 RepID=UPI003A8CC0C5